MPTAHVNGIDIRYELRGDRGPTLALTHGWQNRIEDWSPTALDGLARQFRLLVYDVRGHGRSTAPEDLDAYSMPTYARDLDALLHALDIQRAHILGVSQGGMIVAQFALDFPQRARSLLLCDSTAGNGADEGPGGEWERQIASNLELMEAVVRDAGLEALADIRIQSNRERDAHYFDHPKPVDERERDDRERYCRLPPHAFFGTTHAMRTRPDLSARIRDVRAPVLVLAGEWDDFLPCAERDHQLIEGSRFVLARRAGHNVSDWRPDAFVRAVGDFIADVEAGRDVAGTFEL